MTDLVTFSDAVSLRDHPTRSRTSDRAAREARERALLRVVERHVLPGLVLRAPAVTRPPRFGTTLSEEVEPLTEAALKADIGASQRVLRRLHAGGASFGDLQLGLLAPAARRLDRLWREDAVSFLDVTLAAGSFNQMMRFVALDLTGFQRRPHSGCSILIAPAPGEQHIFGAAMAAEFFRRDGWAVAFEPQAGAADLVALVRARRFDVIGLSIASRCDAEALRATVGAIREASLNRGLLVIAGGEALARDPRLLNEIGADAALAALEVAPARALRLVNALNVGGD